MDLLFVMFRTEKKKKISEILEGEVTRLPKSIIIKHLLMLFNIIFNRILSNGLKSFKLTIFYLVYSLKKQLYIT